MKTIAPLSRQHALGFLSDSLGGAVLFPENQMNSKIRNLTGQRFTRLLAIKLAGRTKGGDAKWGCICDCGKIRNVISSNLVNGTTKSCGCYSRDMSKRTIHGLARTNKYKRWNSMKGRCYNKNNKDYKYYGARGIGVCTRWRNSFENFYADMGERPEGRSLDRIDNDGDYSPENCRWATQTEQNNNRRDTVMCTLNGKTQSLHSWAKELGIKHITLYKRFKKGWSAHKTLTTPVK